MIRKTYPSANVVSLDRSAVNLSKALEPKIIADAFDLPFASNSFDYVFCSSFLHHFRDDEVVDLLRGFSRVARRAVLLVDIERHFVPYWFMRLSQPFLRWHWLTVYDGRLSVRAAFSCSEIKQLVEKAGLNCLDVKTHSPAFRISILASAATN